MWNAFTNIGDASVTLPVALLCTGWLALTDRKLALRWAAMLAAGMMLVGAIKIAYAGWGLSIAGIDFRMIGGHAMLSTAVWTLAAALMLRQYRAGIYVAIAAGLTLGALTGLAHVFDGSHTMPEAVSGWLLGAAITVIFLCTSKLATVRPPNPVVACLGLVLVSTLAYGHHAPFQRLIVAHSPGIRAHIMRVLPAIQRDAAK